MPAADRRRRYGRPTQAQIVTAHPEIDWRSWVGQGNVLTRRRSSP
jgi:hypothetical protein